MATKRANDECYNKAGLDEPILTLRAQDLSADLTVEVWAQINERLNYLIGKGQSAPDALGTIREELGVFLNKRGKHTTKTIEARACAIQMRKWEKRKVAD